MSLTTFTPTSELEAVNALLAATGEAPVTTLDAGRPDVALAQSVLANVLREVCSRRWRFNTALNVPVAKAGAVFPIPAGLIDFDLTPTEEQRELDLIRSGANFSDRITHGTAIPLAELRINPVWFVAFGAMPEAARKLVIVSATRRYVQQTIGAAEAPVQYTAADEQAALAALVESDAGQPPAVPDGTAATETDALNVVLQAAGQPPVRSVLEAHGMVQTALNTLRAAVRELCVERWKFNTTFDTDDQPSGPTQVPFATLPEAARRFVTLRAARRMAAAAGTEPRWTAADEAEALRVLRHDQRPAIVNNMLDSYDAQQIHGWRRKRFPRGSVFPRRP